MRKLVVVLLFALGILSVLTGAAAAVVIGPDDRVGTSTRVDAGDAAALVSGPGLVAYRDVTVVLEATGSGGPVFLGRAHPVDVRDWLGGAPRWVATEAGVSGLAGEAVAAAEGRPGATKPADPASGTFWTQQKSGIGTQSLALDLDGTPTQWVVVPPDSGVVELSVGVELPGVFAGAVALAVAGVVLVAGAVVIRRSGRSASRPADAGPDDDRILTREQAGDGTSQGPVGAVAWLGRLAAAGGVAALAGCGTLPSGIEAYDPDTVSRSALAVDQLAPMLADYDRRNNAAIAATAASRDPKAWASADAEVLLDQDEFSTRFDTLAKEPAAPLLTHRGTRLYASEFTAYPMYVVTATEVTRKGSDTPRHAVGVFVRGSASAPWLQVANVGLRSPQDAPAAAEPGAASTPTTAERAAAAKGAAGVVEYVTTGRSATVKEPDAEMKELATGLAPGEKKDWVTHRVAAGLYANTLDRTNPEKAIRVVRTRDGVMAVASFSVRESFDAGKGRVYEWKDPYGAALGSPDGTQFIERPLGLVVAYRVGSDGTATVIASSWATVR